MSPAIMAGPSQESHGMDLQLSSEHEMVRQMVRDFAQREVAPVIKDWDRRQEMAPQVLPRMGELGILGVCLPVRYGGPGVGYPAPGLGGGGVAAACHRA